MSLRKRERINRGAPDKAECDECGCEQYVFHLAWVDGERLCTTCRMYDDDDDE